MRYTTMYVNMDKEYKISINVTPKAFEGLARQGMLFHQGVCELCDDAIAACILGEKAHVCVALAADPDKHYLQLAVADWGFGMELSSLTNALQLGSAPLNDNRLNEHGYGLNNALACLSGGSGDWCIYTRCQPGPYYKVSGPFDLNMTVKMTNTIDLPETLNLQWPEPSTVIYVRVPMSMARTLQRQGNRKLSDLSTLRQWLVEHLGVAYRGYLELDPVSLEPSAKIAVTIGQSSILVPPIPVPMMMARTERLEIELGGQVVPVTYVHGTLDKSKREHLVHGSKTRFYYQCSQPTQGIDIRLGKRVIATAQLGEIWHREDGSPLCRHNSYNEFVGELILPELPRGVLATLNNKTGIDRNDPDWETIFDALSDFPPQKNAIKYSEDELKNKWMKLLKAANPEDEVTSEISVWPTGTRIDVVDKGTNDKYDIYELKAHKAEPQDLYQLKMYWDGLVLEGIQPTRGFLLVSEYSDAIQKMANAMNTLPTPHLPDGTPSQPYHLLLATHTEKELIKHLGHCKSI